MKNPTLISLVYLLAKVCFAQESVTPLYTYSIVQYQPSSPAGDDNASLAAVSKRTFIASSLLLENNSLMLEFPLRTKKSAHRFGGIGLSISDKDAGDSNLLRSTKVNLSIAYNVRLTRRHSINFGLQPSYVQKRTSLSHVSTGSQWLAAEFRFDPNADLGETFQVDRLEYFTLHAGMAWRFQDKDAGEFGSLGVSMFNMNRPNETFIASQNRIAPSVLVHGEVSLLRTNVLEITPKCFAQIDPFSNLLTGVLSVKFPFMNNNPFDLLRSGSVEVSSNYNSNKSGAVSISFVQPGVSFAFGYVFPVVPGAREYFRNGAEIGISLIKNLNKRKINSTPTISGEKRVFDTFKTKNDSIVPEKPDIVVHEERIVEFSGVRSVGFELDKHFKFGFGSSALTPDAIQFLEELAAFLLKNPNFKVEVVGHTDNIGKPVVNYRLSAARANAVENYLIKAGLEKDRVKSFGAGDTQPLGSNSTEEERAKNRRVHFKIYVPK